MCSAGTAIDYDEDALARAIDRREVEYEITLPGDGAETEVFFSDLSHEYVRINASTPRDDADVATLLEALPYIREFHGKTAVIKYGGAAMEDPALREEFARDVVLLKYVGLNPIVVHGGGPDITAYMERLGLPVQFVGGLRVSDEATVEVAKMVLVGKVNKEIVGRLHRHGQPAVGLCGDDGALFRVARRTAPGGEDIGFVGRIERVNVDVLQHIARDYIPVIASVGADREGHSYNINADEAAGAVARALGAYKMVFLTDVAGWLADPEDPASLIGQATAEQVRDALPGLEGGMRPKLAGLPGGDPGRRQLRAHHRRAHAPFAAAGVLHRRGDRHQDRGRPMNAHGGAGLSPRSLMCACTLREVGGLSNASRRSWSVSAHERSHPDHCSPSCRRSRPRA